MQRRHILILSLGAIGLCLLAGIAYNLWIVKTKRLGDCILAHAVTNASLSAYVIWTGQWRYWP